VCSECSVKHQVLIYKLDKGDGDNDNNTGSDHVYIASCVKLQRWWGKSHKNGHKKQA